MQEPRKETEPHPETIAKMDHNHPLEGSHIVANTNEIPKDQNVIFLNAGHAEKLPKDLFQPSELYYQPTHADPNEPQYNIHVAINITNLIQNPLFSNNVHNTKDFVFKGIYQELNQNSLTQTASMMKIVARKLKEDPTNQAARDGLTRMTASIKGETTQRFNQATAAKEVLKAAGNYETTKNYRSLANETSSNILNQGSLEEQLKHVDAQVKEL